MNFKRLSFIPVFVHLTLLAVAQTDGVLIDYAGNTRDNSAVLDVRSTTQGALLPRLTSAQRTAISSPADGLIVYDTDLNLLYRFDTADGWQPLVSGNTGYVQNQYAAQQAASEFWVSGRGRMDGGLTVGAGMTIDNNNINTGSIANGAIAFGNASGEGIGSKRDAGGNQYGLDFYTNSVNRLAITNGGNVGVGSTAPIAKLDVEGNVAVNDNQIRLRDGADGNHYLSWIGGAVDGVKMNGNSGVVVSTLTGSAQDVAFFQQDYAYFGFDPGSCCNGFEKVKVGRGRNGDGTLETMNNGWGRIGGTNGLAFWANGNADVDDSPQMIIAQNGYVGIGNTNPTAGRLHVSGVGNGGTYAYGWLNSGGSTGTCGSCFSDYSIWADGRIRASEFNAMSDQRVKTNFKQPPTEGLLALVNSLDVTAYEYIDKVEYGVNAKTGFIAQEVERVVPSAVSKAKDYIPSVYEMAQNIEFDQATGFATISVAKNHNLAQNDMVKLVTESGAEEVEIASVPNENTLTVKLKTEPKSVFVYGKMVDDFRAVDYDQLFSIGIGAIQELAKQNAELKLELEKANQKLFEIDELKASVETLESIILQTSQNK